MNLHWLGPKSYADLPAYLAGWDAGVNAWANTPLSYNKHVSPQGSHLAALPRPLHLCSCVEWEMTQSAKVSACDKDHDAAILGWVRWRQSW
jgi:hypothetical protein